MGFRFLVIIMLMPTCLIIFRTFISYIMYRTKGDYENPQSGKLIIPVRMQLDVCD